MDSINTNHAQCEDGSYQVYYQSLCMKRLKQLQRDVALFRATKIHIRSPWGASKFVSIRTKEAVQYEI